MNFQKIKKIGFFLSDFGLSRRRRHNPTPYQAIFRSPALIRVKKIIKIRVVIVSYKMLQIVIKVNILCHDEISCIFFGGVCFYVK